MTPARGKGHQSVIGGVAAAARRKLPGPSRLRPMRHEKRTWLEGLIAHREAGNDSPRHKAVSTGAEHELGGCTFNGPSCAGANWPQPRHSRC